MQYYVLTAEACGFLGNKSIFEECDNGRTPTALHFEFLGVPRTEIVDCSGYCVITEACGSICREHGLSGFLLDSARITISPQSLQLYKELPWNSVLEKNWIWLKIVGLGLVDDFGSHRGCVTISERALNVLRTFNSDWNTVEVEKFEFDFEKRTAQRISEAKERLERKYK